MKCAWIMNIHEGPLINGWLALTAWRVCGAAKPEGNLKGENGSLKRLAEMSEFWKQQKKNAWEILARFAALQ